MHMLELWWAIKHKAENVCKSISFLYPSQATRRQTICPSALGRPTLAASPLPPSSHSPRMLPQSTLAAKNGEGDQRPTGSNKEQKMKTPKRVNFASTPIVTITSPFVTCFDRESFERHLLGEQIRKSLIGRPSFIPDDFQALLESSDGCETERLDASSQTDETDIDREPSCPRCSQGGSMKEEPRLVSGEQYCHARLSLNALLNPSHVSL